MRSHRVHLWPKAASGVHRCATVTTTRATATGNQGTDCKQRLTDDACRADCRRRVSDHASPTPGQPESTLVDDKSASAGAVVLDFTDEAMSRRLPRTPALSPTNSTKVTSPSRLDTATRQMLIGALHRARRSHHADVASSADDTSQRYEAALELQWIEQWAASQVPPSDPSSDSYRMMVKKAVLQRVDLHKPLSYIVGSQPFCGCDIRCEQPLLCPQFETELWTYWVVDTVLSKAAVTQPRSLHVLDMCCGTGCVGVALAKHVPQTYVTAIDVLEEAVRMTHTNARHNLAEPSRVTVHQSDMFDMFLCPSRAPSREQTCQTMATSLPASPSMASTRSDGRSRTDGVPAARASVQVCREAEKVRHGSHDSVVIDADTNDRHTFSGAWADGCCTAARRAVRPEWVHSLDMIVCHPPYILPMQYTRLPDHVTHWQTRMALVGTESRECCHHSYFQELCEYGAVMLKTRRERDAVLRWRPNICIEVGLQACVVASMMERSGWWEDVHVHLDHRQHPRWISANSLH